MAGDVAADPGSICGRRPAFKKGLENPCDSPNGPARNLGEQDFNRGDIDPHRNSPPSAIVRRYLVDLRDFNQRAKEMTKSKRVSFCVAAAFPLAFVLVLFVSAPSHAEIHCAGGHCNCSGDKDCNEMFEHHCAPTGGSCNNDNNTCVCTEAKAESSSGSGSSGGKINKHPIGTMGINKKNQNQQ